MVFHTAGENRFSGGGMDMRHEYCEKNEIIITYSDTDVAFTECKI